MRYQRFTFHFTPTSCSWLNAVEGFFAKLAKRILKRGVFVSVVDLQAAINRFLNPAYSPGCVNGRSLPFWEGSSAA
jgi:transposase